MPAADFSCILHIRVKMNTQPAFGMSPCASMEETYYSPVPCQRISGGFFSSSTSTGIEWPWFARISVCSSLKEYRCFSSVRTISYSRSISSSCPPDRLIPSISSRTSAQPYSSSVMPMAPGWWRRIRGNELACFL